MHRFALWCLTLVLLLPVAAPLAVAQEADEPERPRSVIVATSFQVPLYDRETVLPWMEKYWLPAQMQNPAVTNSALLIHYYGSNSADVVLVLEYENESAILGECEPCDAYAEAHPRPEEGDEGYAEFAEGRDLFQKHYSKHRDEIYNAWWFVQDGKPTVPMDAE